MLEDRRLLAIDVLAAEQLSEFEDLGPHSNSLASLPSDDVVVSSISSDAGAVLSPLSAIPQLQSYPNANSNAYIFLDFDGHYEAEWKSVGGTYEVDTPAYDVDGDPTTFSETELSNIRTIWKGVSEAFSPFNINVATGLAIDDTEYSNVLRVVFGGDGSWYPYSAGGVAPKAGTSNQLGKGTGSAFDLSNFTNTVFVWSGQWNTTYSSDTAAHEAGHALGLVHQTGDSQDSNPDYRCSGRNCGIAPIMGSSSRSDIPRWSNGYNNEVNAYQNELATIVSNRLVSYRPDDHYDTTTLASTVIPERTFSSYTMKGVISRESDVDSFIFKAASNQVQIDVKVAEFRAMLDVGFTVEDVHGNEIASYPLPFGFDNDGQDQSGVVDVQAGQQYVIRVKGSGGYGNVGQYSLSVKNLIHAGISGDLAPMPVGHQKALHAASGFLSKYDGYFTFEWDFDGNGSMDATGKDILFSPTDLADGDRPNIKLYVTGPTGKTDTYSTTITIDNSLLYPQGFVSLPALSDASAAWADFDNDGDLDVALSGSVNGIGGYTQVYANNAGTFTSVASLPLDESGTNAASWADYDNDGDPDLLVTGNSTSLAKLFRNDSGTFVENVIDVVPVSESASAWGDIDLDGDMDLIVSGKDSQGNPLTTFYRNEDGVLTLDAGMELAAVRNGSLDLADYDKDGWIDLLLTGQASTGPVTKVYRNIDGILTDINAGLAGIQHGSARWGDLNADGYLDIAYVGQSSSGLRGEVYRNNSGLSFSFYATLPGLSKSDLHWNDYDLDGDQDLILSGETSDGTPLTDIFRHHNGAFIQYQAGLEAIRGGSVGWVNIYGGQFPEVVGIGGAAGQARSIVHTLVLPGVNAYPVLTNLASQLNSPTSVVLSWDVRDQAVTPSVGLTYNLRIGTTPGGAEILAKSYGSFGNLGTQDSYTLTNLPQATKFYWSVEVTDAAGITTRSPEQAFSTYFVVDSNYSVPGVSDGDSAWGDYDLDGKLDLLILGDTSTGKSTRLYRNTGSGLSLVTTPFPNLANGEAAWGDFDQDGRLDLVLTGKTDQGPYAAIWRNTPSGFVLQQSLEGITYSSVGWVDFDNDGDLDLSVAGLTTAGSGIFNLLENNGGVFSSVDTTVPGFYFGDIAWGDFNNDGWVDLAVTGFTNSGNMTQIFQNTQGQLVSHHVLIQVERGQLDWSDLDGDGDLDLTLYGNLVSFGGYVISYLNDGSNFSSDWGGRTTRNGTLDVVDLDGDGDLDIIITGSSYNGVPETYLWENEDNTVHPSPPSVIGLPQVFASQISWVDYDEDGDLDAFVTGLTGDYQRVAGIYENFADPNNLPPTAPEGLSSIPQNRTDILLQWDPSTDLETPAGQLTYTLRIGTMPGGGEILSAPVVPGTSTRTISAPGVIQTTAGIYLQGFQWGKTYYWSVQAVDSTFAGSAWATERSFIFNTAPSDISLDTELIIPENQAPGILLGKVNAVDPDLIDGDTLAYSLVAGSGDADNALFDIVDGKLYANTSFDFEQQSTRTVRVRVEDSLGAYREEILTFSIEDVNETPNALELTGTSVLENAPRYLIGELSSSDPDSTPQDLRYTLLGENAALFQVVGNELRVHDDALLDYESSRQYPLTIRVSDAGGEYLEKTYTINVIDVDELGTKLLADTNPNTLPSSPREFVELNGVLYFNAEVTDKTGGFDFQRFLYRFDPSVGESELVAEIYFTSNMIGYQDKLYFSGTYQGQAGLIEFDSSTGQIEVFDNIHLSGSNLPVIVNDKLFVWGWSGEEHQYENELMEFDLATRELSQFIDFVPGTDSGSVESYSNKAVANGDELSYVWRADYQDPWSILTYNVTTGASSVFPLPGSVSPYDITSVGDTLYFMNKSGDTADHGLWTFDPNANGGAGGTSFTPLTDPGRMAALDGDLFLGAHNDTLSGTGLYRYDPISLQLDPLSAAGTISVDNIWLFNVDYFASEDHKLYFRSTTPEYGTEVAYFDTQSESVVIQDSVPGPEGIKELGHLVPFDGTIYFTAHEDPYGNELFRLNAQGAVELTSDLNQFTEDSSPHSLVQVDDSIYYFANVGSYRYPNESLWRYDSVTRQTELLLSGIQPNEALYHADGRLYFGGEWEGSRGLIEYDLTTSTVSRYGSYSDQFHVYEIVRGGDVLLIREVGLQTDYATFDLVTKQFTVVSDTTLPISYPVELGEDVYFAWSFDDGGNFQSQQYLWKFESETGTLSPVDNVTGLDTVLSRLITREGLIYFINGDHRLASFDPLTGLTTALSLPNYLGKYLIAFDGALFFQATDQVNDQVGLFRYDFDNQTVEYIPGSDVIDANSPNLSVLGDRLYFRTDSIATGPEIGFYDPSVGVATVIDVVPGSTGSNANEFLVAQGNLYFAADDWQNWGGTAGLYGRELHAIFAAPVAADDSARTVEESSIDIDVLLNDQDPNEDPLAILELGMPAHGMVVEVSPGVVRYMPDADFFGIDTFTYTLADDTGGKSIGTVTVIVDPVNDAPSFTASLIPDADEDSGAHTIENWATLVPGPANESAQQVVAYTVTNVSNSAIFAELPAVDAAGTLTYTLLPGVSGSSSFDVTVQDDGGTGLGGNDTGVASTFQINVVAVNDAPLVTAPALVRAETEIAAPIEGVSISDPDIVVATENEVEVTLTSSHGHLALSMVDGITFTSGNQGDATFTVRGLLADINVALASLAYTSDVGYYGRDTVQAIVSDLGNTGTGGIRTSMADVEIFVVPRIELPIGESVAELLRDGDDLVVRRDAGHEFFRAPLADVDGITIIGTDASDQITINTDGLTTSELSAGLIVYGGEAVGDDDTLVLRGNDTITNHEYTTGGPESGTITLDGLSVQFYEFEPIEDYLISTNRIFRIGTDTGQAIIVEDDDDHDNGMLQIRPGAAGGFEWIKFPQPVELLEISGGAGDDIIELTQLEAGTNALIVLKGQSGKDRLDATNFNGLVHFYGGSGEDVLYGSEGTNLIHGEEGNDTIVDGGGYNVISGGSGANSFIAGTGINEFTANGDEAPGVFEDQYATNEDTPLLVGTAMGVLANDSISSGPSPLIVSTQPAHGQLQMNSDGSFEYTPDADFHGIDQFSYYLEVDSRVSDQVEVTITVASINDEPVANVDYFTTNEDIALSISISDLLTNDVDVESQPIMLESVSTPEHGTLELQAIGNYLYTPTENYFGADYFTYNVSDGAGGIAVGEVFLYVTPVRDAAHAVDDVRLVAPNQSGEVDVLANDFDDDPGVPLTLVDGSLTLLSATDDASGESLDLVESTFSIAGNRIRFSLGSEFDYLPEGETAKIELAYQTNYLGEVDAHSTGKLILVVTGVNDVPYVLDREVLADIRARVGQNSRTFDLTSLFGDVDQDDLLTYSIEENTAPAIVTPTLIAGELMLEFSSLQSGTSTITINATDMVGDSVSHSFSVSLTDESLISLTLASTAENSSVGDVKAKTGDVPAFDEWDSVLVDIWVDLGLDLANATNELVASFTFPKEWFTGLQVVSALGTDASLSTLELADRGEATVTLTGVDLTAYNLLDRILIAQVLLPADATNVVGLPMVTNGEYPQATTSDSFEVTGALVGQSSVPYESQLDGTFLPVVYDADDDGRVGLSDFSMFVGQFGRKVEQGNEVYWFDYDESGSVGLSDFSEFVAYFGKRKETRIAQQTARFSNGIGLEAESLIEAEPTETTPLVVSPLSENAIIGPTPTEPRNAIWRVDVGSTSRQSHISSFVGPMPIESQLIDAVMDAIGSQGNLSAGTEEDFWADRDEKLETQEGCFASIAESMDLFD